MSSTGLDPDNIKQQQQQPPRSFCKAESLANGVYRVRGSSEQQKIMSHTHTDPRILTLFMGINRSLTGIKHD